MRILLVEDNLTLASWLAKSLQQSNYNVDTVHDAADAEQALAFTEYNLVILDLGLPDKTGLDVLEQIRNRGNEVPVIILTANASLDGRIRGLDAGADDYLAKPFELSELEARIRAHLRRASQRTAPVVTCGLLRFDTNTRLFSVGEDALPLAPKEHAVLEQLLRRIGTTVSKATLVQGIYDFESETDENAIEIYIHRLRKKLEGSKAEIVTLRGLGYLLRDAG
ncbi:response regulator [Brucella haematophila]|uniref:Response regulator transcription factor n=1 Tax=Brucella haematophila TaxID=419474 RepID=A0ABX1DN61_9HYPH|nr:response regulator transcription factor [Brucella haematophila]NKC04395.1 response regulator transcription factor [Brucella haematophila]TMU91824.1 response regulator transcription factor [Brucella haematophila]